MKRKTKILIMIGGVTLLAGGGVVVGSIIKKRFDKQNLKLYEDLKKAFLLLCKYDDYVDQMDWMDSRDQLADILCLLEPKSKHNELAKLVPWMFSPD